MTYPLVSVVIASWNGKHLLSECLNSLAAQRFRDFEVIVVDNGSVDGSVGYVGEQYPDVRVVGLRENLGFAGGNNAGIRIARGNYIALLNNDATVDPAWLSDLMTAAEASASAVGMWACKIVSYSDHEVIDNVGLLLYPDGMARGKGRLEKDYGQYDVPTEAFFPSGCAGLFRREMLDEIGLFDEAFFAYADDVDLGLRARLAGWGCVYVPSAKAFHKYSSSSSAYSPLKAFLVERNRIWVLLKYYPLELIAASPYFTLKRLIMHLYGAVMGKGASGKFSEEYSVLRACSILIKAWVSALRSLPGIIRQRRAFSRLKRTTRPEIYRLFRTFRISAREIALKE